MDGRVGRTGGEKGDLIRRTSQTYIAVDMQDKVAGVRNWEESKKASGWQVFSVIPLPWNEGMRQPPNNRTPLPFSAGAILDDDKTRKLGRTEMPNRGHHVPDAEVSFG